MWGFHGIQVELIKETDSRGQKEGLENRTGDKYRSVGEGPGGLQELSLDWRLRQEIVLFHAELSSSLNAHPALVLETKPRNKETELGSEVYS